MTASGGASVQLNSMVKEHPTVTAVNGVSLDVQPGEFLALLGPSGSGKTTILMAIAGFVSLTSGDVLIDNKTVARLPPHRRNIGVVFQNYALFPHMTVFDNISFPLKMRSVSPAQRREMVHQALAMVHLEGTENRYPHQLSGGQQQRVAVARAIVFKPRVLLMDEPLGALDLKLRRKLQLELKALHRQLGCTIIYVTHDQGEALTMATRVAVLDRGELRQIGTPHELYNSPTDPFVADFVGEANLLDATVLNVDGNGAAIVLGGGTISLRRLGGQAAPGDRLIVSVRPERVSIHEPDGKTSGLPGTVQEVVFQGDSVLMQVSLEDGQRLAVKASDTRIADRWSIGAACRVDWSADDAIGYVTRDQNGRHS